MPVTEIGKAFQYLEQHGIPNNKQENYKYCNTEAIIRKEFKALDGKEIDVTALENLKHNYFVEGASTFML